MTTFMEGLVVALLGAVGIAVLMLVLGAIYAFPVMWIWNWLMPELFALPVITFWQAFWGTFMCSLLFKGSSTTKAK